MRGLELLGQPYTPIVHKPELTERSFKTIREGRKMSRWLRKVRDLKPRERRFMRRDQHRSPSFDA
jgi:hypothetical protein